MYYFIAGRDAFLRLLPKGMRWAEIGVFAGDNAARLVELCDPSELHLIDPWFFNLDFDWFNPPEWSPLFGDARRLVRQLSVWANIPKGRHVNEHFDALYQHVMQRFSGNHRVTIHRSTSADVVNTFPDQYFDFVYIDGDHRYEAVLRDLQLYNSKLTDQGTFLGDDFCEHGAFENAEYGVIAAVNKFIKRAGQRTLIVNNERFSFFALVRNDQLNILASDEQRNIARGRPARQSSTSAWSRHSDAAEEARRGNDGTTTGGYGFHTDYEYRPWWEVDLGEMQAITRIRVFNRLGATASRANNLEIFASLDGQSWKKLYSNGGVAFGGADGLPLIVDLAPPWSARFVKLQLDGEDYLHLDEVEVYTSADSATPRSEAVASKARRVPPRRVPPVIQAMIDSEIPFIELNDALIPNYHHQWLLRSDGNTRGVPSF